MSAEWRLRTVFQILSGGPNIEYALIDGTIVRVQHGTGAKGGSNQAIGRSRGGLTTKIVALVDALRSLARFVLLRPTPRQRRRRALARGRGDQGTYRRQGFRQRLASP